MTSASEQRSECWRDCHGAPTRVFPADEDGVAVEAYELDFSTDPNAEDRGFVLVTNGMSDRRMHLDDDAEEGVASGEVKPRAELVWYVRELDEDYVALLRWLAEFPFIDETWLGFGHTIPMPEPILPDTALTTFLFLTPIIGRHAELELAVDGEPVELLVVHLLTDAEYALKREHGTDAILTLFDDHAYPLVLDPSRDSMV
ncbi:MAG TPA: suppressor of fused domain protein [Nannocystaceae bacterium]|nr:suppressor of fused domain protein [Nannocystaceae bacterium]